MKNLVLVSVLLIVLVLVAGLWTFRSSWLPSGSAGFNLVRLSDNSVLLSDEDVLSFNSTNQEMALSDMASKRLLQVGDSLYMFNSTVSVRVNGEEVYQGIFRMASMSALPAPPKIAILFPSMDFPTGVENDHALKLFYPFFEPTGELAAMNAKLTKYFQETNRFAS